MLLILLLMLVGLVALAMAVSSLVYSRHRHHARRDAGAAHDCRRRAFRCSRCRSSSWPAIS